MKHYILLSLALFSFWSHAQFSIEGIVTDASDNTPVEQATVYLPTLEKGVVTDNQGAFKINNLPVGDYKLLVSYLGYKTYSTNISIGPGQETLSIALEPSAIEIEEVIVSTPFHKLQRENVMKVEQARMADLQAKGSITLSDGLTNIPGVESLSTGVGIGKPVIRGLSANRVLVYAQGVRLENQQFGEEHGLGVNDAGIESVEVIKGPASLLYGSDALGGVLYLNPEKFAMAGESEGDIGVNYFSNTSGLAGNAGVKSSGEHFKFLLRGSLASHTDYEGGDGLRVTNSRFKEYDIKTGMGYQTGALKTELRYNFNVTDLGIPEEIAEQNRDRDPMRPFQQIDNHILSSDTDLFFKTSSLSLTLGYIFNDRKEFEEIQDPNSGEGNLPSLHMQLATFNYNLLYHLPKSKKLETIVGIQGMRQTNENSGEEVLIPDATTNDFGVLATSHVHFAKSDFQFGLRYDHRGLSSIPVGVSGDPDFIGAVDKDFNSFNAAAGYRIDLGKYIIGRINLASGFRAPNLAELTSNGVHEGTNRYEIGNPDLGNEKNLQTDIALEYKNEHLELYVNGFYNSISDYIYIEPNGNFIDTEAVFVYRQQDAALYGGEIGVHIHPHPLDWLHIESSFESVKGTPDSGGNLPLIPARTLRNTLRLEFDSKDHKIKSSYAYLALNTYFEQNKVSAFETPSPGYTLLNAGLGGKAVIFGQNLEFRVSGNNLLDKTYISHLSRLKQDGIANIGRNISIGLKMPI